MITLRLPDEEERWMWFAETTAEPTHEDDLCVQWYLQEDDVESSGFRYLPQDKRRLWELVLYDTVTESYLSDDMI